MESSLSGDICKQTIPEPRSLKLWGSRGKTKKFNPVQFNTCSREAIALRTKHFEYKTPQITLSTVTKPYRDYNEAYELINQDIYQLHERVYLYGKVLGLA